MSVLIVFPMESPDRKQTHRKLKMKFDLMELGVLVEEANKHIGELQQRNLTTARRNTIWESICEKVKAVTKRTRRTPK